MADVQANIVLTTTGGDESAAEISKASMALENVTSSSTGMEGAFQHRFQHIGLMLFAGDALRASGLGRETRLMVSALNAAITAGGAAAGISSGGVLLLVTAFIALAGIAAKVIQHHKDETDALKNLDEQQTKALGGYEKETSALERIQAAGGNFTTSMAALLAADKAVESDMRSGLLATQEKEVAALLKQRDAVQEAADRHAMFAKAMDVVKESLQQLLAPFEKVINFTKQLAASFAAMVPSMSQHVALTGITKQKYDELTASIARVQMQHQQLSQGGSRDLQQLASEAEKDAKAEEEAYKKMWDQRIKDARAYSKEHEQEIAKDAQKVKQATDFMGSAFGSAFAKMLVEGKSFTEEMQAAFTQMAEHIIEMIVKMIAEWAVFTAMTGFGGSIGAMGAAGLAKGFATGGSAFADTPTLAMFGEAGPEMATFTPLGEGMPGGGGGGGGGTTINIGTISTSVAGVNNPDEIARQVGQKIVEEIRGRGQISFARS